MMSAEEILRIEKKLEEHDRRISELESLFQTKSEVVKKEISMKKFILLKKPRDNVQKTLTIGYYLEKYEGLLSFNVKDLESGFRDAKEQVPKNINLYVTLNVSKGHMMEAKERKDNLKAWALTNSGEKYVEGNFLISQAEGGSIGIIYFEPGKPYTSKRLLSKNILGSLKGELRIVDPYCSERTLDILRNIENEHVKFLTRVGNLRAKEKERFLRELQDFKSEKPNTEFRNYPNTDIHDRYIISADSLVVLGHSIKDLGGKESFAISLNKDASKNIVEAITDNFDRRWKQSSTL